MLFEHPWCAGDICFIHRPVGDTLYQTAKVDWYWSLFTNQYSYICAPYSPLKKYLCHNGYCGTRSILKVNRIKKEWINSTVKVR